MLVSSTTPACLRPGRCTSTLKCKNGRCTSTLKPWNVKKEFGSLSSAFIVIAVINIKIIAMIMIVMLMTGVASRGGPGSHLWPILPNPRLCLRKNCSTRWFFSLCFFSSTLDSVSTKLLRQGFLQSSWFKIATLVFCIMIRNTNDNDYSGVHNVRWGGWCLRRLGGWAFVSGPLLITNLGQICQNLMLLQMNMNNTYTYTFHFDCCIDFIYCRT